MIISTLKLLFDKYIANLPLGNCSISNSPLPTIPEYNETKSFKYCVPANKRLIIKNLNVSGTLDDLTNIKIFYKPYNQPAILITDLDVNTSSFFTITKPINIKLTSKTDVYGTVKLSHSPSGGKIDSISAQIECELYTEQDIPNIIIS